VLFESRRQHPLSTTWRSLFLRGRRDFLVDNFLELRLGCAPTIERPLIKNAGVHRRQPSRRPSDRCSPIRANCRLNRPISRQFGRTAGFRGAESRQGENFAAGEARSDAGEKAGVDGTPAFFINGRSIVGAQPMPQFEKVIDEEIATAAQKEASAK